MEPALYRLSDSEWSTIEKLMPRGRRGALIVGVALAFAAATAAFASGDLARLGLARVTVR